MDVTPDHRTQVPDDRFLPAGKLRTVALAKPPAEPSTETRAKSRAHLPRTALPATPLRAIPTRILLLILLMNGVLVSCGGPKRPPPTDVPGYDRLRDELGDFDFRPLAGRRIILDPGHGGFFRGAVGLNGLTEAEVNLGVALYLRGLLEWAGAEVFMTRTADYDFLTPADSSLTSDLAARVAFSDSIQPDVFVSIHHNSNAALDRDLNETQTYYPVGREGIDLDLARCIHMYLVRNLNIEPAKIMAGNFYVLRHASVPAVLGEPSMISHPVIERRLSQAAKQELEAKAYFLGLLAYFAGGTPYWTCAYGDTVRWDQQAPPWLRWTFVPGDPLAPSLDPASVELQLDGTSVPVTVEAGGRAAVWYPTQVDLQQNHQLELRARNLRGRSTPVLSLALIGLASSTDAFETQIIYENEQVGAPRALFVWRSLGRSLAELPPLHLARERDGDPCGFSIASLPVFPGHEGWLLLPADRLPPTQTADLRICREYDIPDMPDTCSAAISPFVHNLPASYRWYVLAQNKDHWPDSPLPGGTMIRRLEPTVSPDRTDPPFAGYPTWPVFPAQDGAPIWLEAAGVLPIVTDADHQVLDRSWTTAQPDTFQWRPILPELLGKVIVIDPHGGGSESDGAGPLGTRGSDLNLRVAEMAASLLQGVGAKVVLTRTNEVWLPPEEKVLLGNRHHADLFLAVERSQDPGHAVTAEHHHGSRTGREWANLFARAAASLLAGTQGEGGDSVLVRPSYAYLLRHTACPALRVGLEPPTSLTAEEKLNEPSYQQAQARALFLSVAAVLAGESLLDRTVDLGNLLTANRQLLPPRSEIDWVAWDGNFSWLPPRWSATPGDTVSFPETPGLPAETDIHFLEVRTRAEWQLWALRPAARGEWEWKKLLSGMTMATPELQSAPLPAPTRVTAAGKPVQPVCPSRGGAHP